MSLNLLTTTIFKRILGQRFYDILKYFMDLANISNSVKIYLAEVRFICTPKRLIPLQSTLNPDSCLPLTYIFYQENEKQVC